jgi:hypothetical protein
LIAAEKRGDAVKTRWSLKNAGITAVVTVRYKIWGKSLVLEIIEPKGRIAVVTYGRAVGFKSPKLVT